MSASRRTWATRLRAHWLARALSLPQIAKHVSTAANPPMLAQPAFRSHAPKLSLGSVVIEPAQTRNLYTSRRHRSPPHLRVFPDVVVRAHQVAQQEVELLLFRHCKSGSKKKTSRVDERRDEPGGELLRSHNTAGALLAGFIASSRRSLKRVAEGRADSNRLSRLPFAYWVEGVPHPVLRARVVLVTWK